MQKVKPTVGLVLSIILLFIIIYVIDALFLKHLFWERLAVNVIIVLTYFTLFYKFVYIKQTKNDGEN